jgi:hypothetical protein
MGKSEFDKVMKGVSDPKKHNPDHKRLEKQAEAKRKATEKALAKRKGKHATGKHRGGDDVIDSGMFS